MSTAVTDAGGVTRSPHEVTEEQILYQQDALRETVPVVRQQTAEFNAMQSATRMQRQAQYDATINAIEFRRAAEAATSVNLAQGPAGPADSSGNALSISAGGAAYGNRLIGGGAIADPLALGRLNARIDASVQEGLDRAVNEEKLGNYFMWSLAPRSAEGIVANVLSLPVGGELGALTVQGFARAAPAALPGFATANAETVAAFAALSATAKQGLTWAGSELGVAFENRVLVDTFGVRAYLIPESGVVTNGATFGNAVTYDYRATFFAANPELEGQVVVHHAVEQQVLTRYPGVVSEAEMHSLDNLRGIPNELNSDLHLSQIRREWNQFYRQTPNPTKEMLLQKATEIDAKFGTQFNPPVGR